MPLPPSSVQIFSVASSQTPLVCVLLLGRWTKLRARTHARTKGDIISCILVFTITVACPSGRAVYGEYVLDCSNTGIVDLNLA